MGKVNTIVSMLLLALTVGPSDACLGFPMWGGWGEPSEFAEGAHQAIDVISAVVSMGSWASGMKREEKKFDPLASVKSQADSIGGVFSKALAGAGAMPKDTTVQDPATAAKAAVATAKDPAAGAMKTAAAAVPAANAAKSGLDSMMAGGTDLMSKAGDGFKSFTGGFGFGR